MRGFKQIVVNTLQGLSDWIRLFHEREETGEPSTEMMRRHLEELNSAIDSNRYPASLPTDDLADEEEELYKIVLFAHRRDGTRQEVELEGIVFSAATITGDQAVLRGLDDEELVGIRLMNYNGIYTLVDEKTGNCIGELRRETTSRPVPSEQPCQ